MPRPKRPDYNPPADLLGRLPKASITRGEKLKALEEMIHRQPIEWRERHAKVLRAIDADVRAAGRAQKDSASAATGAPSKTGERTEQGSSIPPKALERKIETAHESLSVEPLTSTVALNICEMGDPVMLTPDQARQLAALLIEAADDVDRDAAVREHYAQLVNTTG